MQCESQRTLVRGLNKKRECPYFKAEVLWEFSTKQRKAVIMRKQLLYFLIIQNKQDLQASVLKSYICRQKDATSDIRCGQDMLFEMGQHLMGSIHFVTMLPSCLRFQERGWLLPEQPHQRTNKVHSFSAQYHRWYHHRKYNISFLTIMLVFS